MRDSARPSHDGLLVTARRIPCRWMFGVALSIIGVTWPTARAHGQMAPTVLHSGDLLRVSAPQLGVLRGRGSVVDVRADTVVFAIRGAILEPGEQFALSLLERLEVSRGRKSHATAGAVAGAVLGAVAGALLFKRSCDDTAAEGAACPPSPLAPLLGAAGGAIGGWFVGGLYRPHQWEPVSLTPYAIGVVGSQP